MTGELTSGERDEGIDNSMNDMLSISKPVHSIDGETPTLPQTNIVEKTIAAPQRDKLDETQLQPIWEELHNLYQRSLIMKFNDSERFRIWISDPKWKLTEEAQTTSFNTKESSSFKIVTRSRMPFHGPMSTSPLNQKFLEICGLTDSPENVTIVPLFDMKYIVGFLVVIGDKSTNSTEALRLAEECGLKISDIITGPTSSEAA